MPIESIEWLGTALNFLSGYITEKGLDTFINRTISHQEEMSIPEHVYCMLTESLRDFSQQHQMEFDENAIIDTFSFSSSHMDTLNCAEGLKLILENATGLEISPELLETWIATIENHLVSNKHEKLFRAIQLKNMKEMETNFTQPEWMQKYMVNNFFEIAFAQVEFDALFKDLRTNLSNECWMQTQDLILELSLNAFQHGNAEHVWLHINEKGLSVLDDGTPFDTTSLLKTSTELSGGNWTINRYIASYPEINISYRRTQERNETSILFEDTVFHVNGLCQIFLPKRMMLNLDDIVLKYPHSKARYYYVDFSSFKAERSFLCMSGAYSLVDALVEFCSLQNADVFLYLPIDNLTWDDFIQKLHVCAEHGQSFDRIHIIRD